MYLDFTFYFSNKKATNTKWHRVQMTLSSLGQFVFKKYLFEIKSELIILIVNKIKEPKKLELTGSLLGKFFKILLFWPSSLFN